MDLTLYNAAMRGNIGDANFLLADHLKRDEENGYQVTPKGNTVLHVSALYGRSHFVREVLKITPPMLCCQNKKNETALGVIHVLLAHIEDHNTKEKRMRMTDASGDTALHKAVRSQRLDVVKLLVKEDPEFEFPPNHAQETPLYLAAESGFHDALINILGNCIRSLWRWNKPLCDEPDLWGWNSLHYAVKLGLADVVSDMLAWKKSLVYLPAGSENAWTTAIHIAASEGDVNMIIELLNHCPDGRDILNSNNQNALHVAPDSDGNTPLHLLAASGNHVLELINHPRAKKMSFNKQNQTPLDIALSCTVSTEKFKDYAKRKKDLHALTNLQILSILDAALKHQEKLVEDLCSIGRFGKRDFEVKRKYEYVPNPNAETGKGVKVQLREDDQDKAKKADQTVIESIMKSAQIHVVVATLIKIVTFAAGIT
ncbi:hypothetical protein P3L10_016447 [Capsicum annuum]